MAGLNLTLKILSRAVGHLEAAARVARSLSNWVQDFTELSAFNELAQKAHRAPLNVSGLGSFDSF